MKRAMMLSAALALAGCGGSDDGVKQCNGDGGDNRLEGSYCENVEMVFTDVRVQRLDSGDQSFLLIEYVRPLGTGLEKTLSVTFDTSRVVVETGKKIDLLAIGGVVRRVLAESSMLLTDQLEDPSTVELTAYGAEIGSRVAGQVDLSFMNGRKLTGHFDATLEDAAAGL